jgi:hypothetical protein
MKLASSRSRGEPEPGHASTISALAALLEQTAKYGVRAFLFNQNPERLTAPTWNAVSTNRSHLATTTLNAKGAALLARELGSVEPPVITRLARYTYLTSVTLAGAASPPFLVHGAALEDLYPDAHERDERPALEAAIDRRIARRPVAETLRALDEHDQRIHDALDPPSPEPARRRSGRHTLSSR